MFTMRPTTSIYIVSTTPVPSNIRHMRYPDTEK